MSVPAAPIRVVIADDAVGLRRLLRAVLTRQPGFEVVGEAGNGAEALMAVSRTRPDLVLLDLGMPVMDGLEALPRIIELSPSTRVVVLSGFNPGRMEHEALALGAHAYLTKGLSPDELVAALHRAVEGDGPDGPARPVAAEPAHGWGQVIEELVAGRGMTSVFQPVVDLATGRTAGYEALGRPAGGDPDADVEPLFDAAERLGYGRDLDWLCRRVALQEARSLPAGSTLFVNVGVSALLDPVHDVDQMLLLLRWAGRPASEVVLEITERELVVDHGRLAEVLASYRSHGFRFAVDDLGDGHSTLEMLAASVPEFLKISGRITRSATSVGPRSAICAMVAFAAQSGARVVAEGIENPTHLRLMQELGVELGQGFGLERPALATVWANGRS